MFLASLLLSLNLFAYTTDVLVTGHETPAEIQNVGVEEHLGRNLDLALTFTDDLGQKVPLGTYFNRGRPVLMAMIYYNCPSLCSYHLNGLTETMKLMKWSPGREYEMVIVSMDHTENSELAAAKKANYLKLYGRPETAEGWHFLTGSQENVKALADQLGFKFTWMPDKKQFAHAAVSYVVTPQGVISRYLHGIQPELNTLKLSLLEASNGAIGNTVERILSICFKFDPHKKKYTLYAWNLMRIGALLMVLLLVVILVPAWWREQRR